MRMFVSSRINHESQPARKSAIEALHDAGHRVLYIEGEQSEEDPGQLRMTMEGMISNADVFVGVYHVDSKGVRSSALDGLTPIEFELSCMVNTLKRRGREQDVRTHLLLFQLRGTKQRWLSKILKSVAPESRPPIIEYGHYNDLIGTVFDKAYGASFPPSDITRRSNYTIQIEYHGRDEAGLLQIISEFLVSHHAMNVNDVWASSRQKNALLYLSASWIGDDSRRPTDRGTMENALRSMLEQRLEVKLDERSLRVYDNGGLDDGDHVYGYFDIRVIDAPGQLNTICKALKRYDLNITRINLTPAPLEFHRQTSISLEIELDRRGSTDMTRRAKFLQLETLLRDLIGVRSMTSRLAHPALVPDPGQRRRRGAVDNSKRTVSET